MEAGIFSPTDRLLDDYQGLDDSGRRLDRTQRMALEAEEIGANVLGDLRRQREQIQRASRVLHETDNDLDQSNRLLKDILRMYTTKHHSHPLEWPLTV
jgi:vesicle transport through interaction with t-SNAREs protein 1